MISRVWDVCVVGLICFLCVASAKTEELKIELKAGKYEIVKTSKGFHEIRMEKFGNLLTPGKPMLPGKTFVIAIPVGAVVNSIEVMRGEENEIRGRFRIAAAPAIFPMDHRKDLIKEASETYLVNSATQYSTSQCYPEKTGWYSGKGALGKYNFVKVTFAPFGYYPKSGKLVFFRRAFVTINYSVPTSSANKLDSFAFLRTETLSDKRAANILLNYNTAKKWYAPQPEFSTPSQTYDYVIITTVDLQNAVSSLVNWKVSVGFSVNVLTTDWINSLYSGSDLPERIRNFLIDKYGQWGIDYVLLVGDINDIPMRICYPRANSSLDATPTDYYYADLTGDWNSDGDSYFGEYGQDNVDWLPEVLVGRIPWSISSTVEQICQKLVNFERDMGSWKRNALLLGAMSNYKNEGNSGYSRTDGAALMEIHKQLVSNSGGSSTTLYEKAGVNPNTNFCSAPLTHANVITNWSSGQYGMVNWWAHGSSSKAYRKWWSSDDGDNVPETSDPNEMSRETMISTNDCDVLNDSHASIIFANSCNNGYPENNNLGKAMIKQGSAGIVASSRLSWYSIGWSNKDHGGNASLDYYFFEYLINGKKRVGEALYNAKVYYANHFLYSSWGWVCWQNLFDFNLYGDPSLCRTGLSSSVATYNISGKIYYLNSIPVSDTDLNLSGNSENIQKTDGSGFYQFPSLPSGANFIVTPIQNSSIAANCILSYDAALTAQIALGLYVGETNEQRTAADVDKNGSVQIYDAALIAQYAVGLPLAPNSKVGEWIFAPSHRIYQPLSTEYTNQDFSAIILGDVDGNWGANGILTNRMNLKKKYAPLTDAKVFPESNYKIPLLVEDDSEIISFDVRLNFDVEIMKYVGITRTDEVKDFKIYTNCSEDGVIKVAGFSLQPAEVSGNYLTLNFIIVGNTGKSGQVNLMNYTVNDKPGFSALAKVKIEDHELSAVPLKYNLSQNYPNPFNPSTTIQFEIPNPSFVSITVFNLLGERISMLVDEEKEAGRFSVSWNGQNEAGAKVPSGLYFYQLHSDEFSRTYKMLLTK